MGTAQTIDEFGGNREFAHDGGQSPKGTKTLLRIA